MTTLHDIAKKANVSYMTVARVLSGQNKENRPSSIARAAKIRRVAQEMGYRPNAAARAVIQGKFSNVVLLQCQEDSAAFRNSSLCWAVEESLSAHKYRVTLHQLNSTSSIDESLAKSIFGEAFADGMLINCQSRETGVIAGLVQKNQIPAIWLHSHRPTDAARINDFQGGVLATEHLLAQGHKNIAYLDISNYVSFMTDENANACARDRYAGYLEAMKKAGLPTQSFFTKQSLYSQTLGDLPVDALFAPDGPTALISYGPEGLIRLHTLAEVRSKRLQLVTFGESAQMLGREIPVDTVLIPEARLAETAIELLLQKISKPDQPLPAAAIPYEKVATYTTGTTYDGMRAAERSLSICSVPEQPIKKPADRTVVVRQSHAAVSRITNSADPGTYAQRHFAVPPIRHDSAPAVAPSPTVPVAVPSARESVDRP